MFVFVYFGGAEAPVPKPTAEPSMKVWPLPQPQHATCSSNPPDLLSELSAHANPTYTQADPSTNNRDSTNHYNQLV